MKKIIYTLIGGIILAFVVYMIQFLRGPHSLIELYTDNYMKIMPENGTSSFNYFDMKEYNNSKFFLYKGNLVMQKEDDDEKKILVKNVEQSLIWHGKLVYTLFDVKNKVYIRDLQNGEEHILPKVEPYILICDKDNLYIYTDKDVLYRIDCSWNKVKIVDFKEKGIKKVFEKACIVEGKLILVTESMKMYVYDEEKDEIKAVPLPKTELHSEDEDIIRWNGKVYYMLSYYNDGDMHNGMTRVDSSESGIYELNAESGRLTKVSEEVGDVMLAMDGKLYVAELQWFGLSYRLKATNIDRQSKKGD